MNQIPNIEETNTIEVEDLAKMIDLYGKFCADPKQGSPALQAEMVMTTIHQQLQKAREEERERIATGLDELMEKLADIEHIRWAKWQNYLHSHLTWNNEIQAWVLLHEWKDRWQMQINKPYSMLSEKEKESDREQVRPYLELIKRKVRDHSELDQEVSK